MKERIEFDIAKIKASVNEDDLNPMYKLRLGTFYMMIGNLNVARNYFLEARTLINEGHQAYTDKILSPEVNDEKVLLSNQDDILKQIQLSIRYTEKPLPWSRKGAQDYSNSTMFYMLVERFGNRRYNF